jgi:hypothetical protein
MLSLYPSPEGERPLGRSRRRREDNIKIDNSEVVWGKDWIDLPQDRERWRAVVNVVRTCWFNKTRGIS